MALIKNLKKQQEALSKVNGILSSIKQANRFIRDSYAGNKYEISYYVPDDDYGTTTKTVLLCEDKESFTPMIIAYKKSLIKELRELIEEYNISLSKDELKLIEE